MDSKNDDTHTPDEAHDDASQSQFLAALLAAAEEGATSGEDRERVAENGMALSSGLDDIELPGVSRDSGNARSDSSVSFKKTENWKCELRPLEVRQPKGSRLGETI